MNLAIMAVRVSRNLRIPIGSDALHFVESPMITNRSVSDKSDSSLLPYHSAVVEGPLLAALLLPESAVAEVDADVGDLAVDGLAVVVEGGRLQDDAGGADEDGQREDPQEEAVQHHRHVLPVLLHLREG